MRQSRKKAGVYMILLDCLIVLISLTAAWIIRAQFSFFLFDVEKFLIVLPYVVVIRILINAFFEHYSISFRNLQLNDIIAIFLHSIIPSLIFLLVRLFSPIRVIRMPLSMIALEYMFTVTGMIFVRIAAIRLIFARPNKESEEFYRKAIIAGRTSYLKTPLLAELSAKYHIEIVGIVSPDPLEWNTDFSGIRIVGGYEALDEIVQLEQALALMLIHKEVSHKDRIFLLDKCLERSLLPLKLDDNTLKKLELIDSLPIDPPAIQKVPAEIVSSFRGKSLVVIGRESSVHEYIVAFCKKAKIGFVSCSLFTGIDDFPGNGEVTAFIDLKYLVLDEKSVLNEEAIRECLNHLKAVESKLESVRYSGTYLFVIPATIDALKNLVRGWKRISILFTEGLITENLLNQGTSMSKDRLWESPQDITGFIFKALHLSVGSQGNYCANSDHAVTLSQIDRAKGIISDLVVSRDKQFNTAYKDRATNEYLRNFKLIETSFSNMYRIEGLQRSQHERYRE